ncbi:hypothetical protein F7725_028059, partial [Dissostichus mawsoni]
AGSFRRHAQFLSSPRWKNKLPVCSWLVVTPLNFWFLWREGPLCTASLLLNPRGGVPGTTRGNSLPAWVPFSRAAPLLSPAAAHPCEATDRPESLLADGARSLQPGLLALKVQDMRWGFEDKNKKPPASPHLLLSLSPLMSLLLHYKSPPSPSVTTEPCSALPHPSSSFLPPCILSRLTQSGQFVIVEPPHGEVVERKVCTEREADIQIEMHKAEYISQTDSKNKENYSTSACFDTNRGK